MGLRFLTLIGCAATLTPCLVQAQNADAAGWPHYGGALDGARYSAGTALTRKTVGQLREVWRYRTGDAADGKLHFGKPSSFKATPILFDGKLIFPTGFNRVIALDPVTGAPLWRFDPHVDLSVNYAEMFTARGVAAWSDTAAMDGDGCAHRVFLGTLDARLIAIDARTGTRCPGFGSGGAIDLSQGVRNFRRGEYSVTSPPTVVGDLVVVGSSIGDNGGVALDRGIVRAFDARTGRLRWTFDPIPAGKAGADARGWPADSARRTGGANVWSVMAADAERDLIFLPTTSPSPDFFGGERMGDNRHANSVVALRASTGELVWAYQTVRHDLWDYDLAAQPMLVDLTIAGKKRAALVQAGKTGFIFVLDRETGQPLTPVEDRAVPASDVPGERAAAAQPFPLIQLHPTKAALPPIWNHSAAHVAKCRAMMAGVRYAGIFTPPSLAGTLLFPGNPGGVNWGSMAYHPGGNIALVAVNRLPTVVKLIPRADFGRLRDGKMLNGVPAEFTAQSGTPFGMARYELFNPESGLHCLEGPWATLVALNLSTGEKLWEVPAGTAPGVDPTSPAAQWGYFANSGPIVTAGGVAFLATQYDRKLRAYDAATGGIVWSASLPAGPHATPMTFEQAGRPYVIVTAGGATEDGKERGDYVIAFALPTDG